MPNPRRDRTFPPPGRRARLATAHALRLPKPMTLGRAARLTMSGMLVAACDPVGVPPAPPASPAGAFSTPHTLGADDMPAINRLVSQVTTQIAAASSDADRGRQVLDAAARDLQCPRGEVAVAMTFDRRFGNSFSLRYLVEGCGTRALYGEDCQQMDACEYVLVSRTSLEHLQPLAPVLVPLVPTSAALPPELRGLSVHVEPHLVGEPDPGTTREQALATCTGNEIRLVQAMGWTVAEDTSKAGLVARFACMGHVKVDTESTTLRMRLPSDGTPALVLLAGERSLLTVPAGATHLVCQARRDAAPTWEADCLRRASVMAGALVTAAITASPEVQRLARQRRPGGP